MTEGELLIALFIFVLAFFVGAEVISKVPPMLHTPLMSGANAISGITLVGALLVGALLVAGPVGSSAAAVPGLGVVVLSTVNVVGGFMVTDRMLRMFKKDSKQ